MSTAKPGFSATEFEFDSELAAGSEPDVRTRVVWSRLEIADEFNLAAGALDTAKDLVIGESGCGFMAVSAEAHAVNECAFAVRGREAGFQNVGVFDVAAGGGENVGGMEEPVASDLYIEKSGEQGRAVETWPAQPIDGSIARDEGGGTTVADDSVISDGALLAIVHSSSSMRSGRSVQLQEVTNERQYRSSSLHPNT